MRAYILLRGGTRKVMLTIPFWGGGLLIPKQIE